jgi:prepilin signal peptidase PulO-like enzyme (type II secretory pathway)
MWAVSVVVGLTCIALAIIFAWHGNMQWPRIIVGLVITGSAGLMNGTLGPPVHRWVTQIDRKVGDTTGHVGGVVPGLVALWLLAFVAFRIWRNVIDLRTVLAAAAVPPTVAFIPGLIGKIAIGVVGVIPTVFSAVISFFFFGHW